MRTDHRIRVCDFVYLFWAHSCLLRAPVPCARVCGRATHGLPTMWALVYRGCPCRDPPVYPPMPRQDGIGDKAPTLCCACVASSWHAHSTIWKCGVWNMCADCHEMSAEDVNFEWNIGAKILNSTVPSSSRSTAGSCRSNLIIFLTLRNSFRRPSLVRRRSTHAGGMVT